MPLPEELARFNKRFSNKLIRPLARVMPGLGVLHHRGRKTGTKYETPLNVFRDGQRLVVPLTYGEKVDWLRNARAAPRNEIVSRGELIDVGMPYPISTEAGMATVPAPVRMALSRLGVTGFVAFPRNE